MYNIAIAEDNFHLASFLKEKLLLAKNRFNVKYVARDGKDIVDFVHRNKNLDLILMDIEMPILDGIKATEIISEIAPDIKIIILTIFDDEEKIFKAIQAGANGYLLKDESIETILESIEIVLSGGASKSSSVAAKTLSLLKKSEIKETQPKEDFNFTKREIEILECLKMGYDYKKVADKLFISPFTVRKHIENIYRKLQVQNKMQAVNKSINNRIIK